MIISPRTKIAHFQCVFCLGNISGSVPIAVNFSSFPIGRHQGYPSRRDKLACNAQLQGKLRMRPIHSPFASALPIKSKRNSWTSVSGAQDRSGHIPEWERSTLGRLSRARFCPGVRFDSLGKGHFGCPWEPGRCFERSTSAVAVKNLRRSPTEDLDVDEILSSTFDKNQSFTSFRYFGDAHALVRACVAERKHREVHHEIQINVL